MERTERIEQAAADWIAALDAERRTDRGARGGAQGDIYDAARHDLDVAEARMREALAADAAPPGPRRGGAPTPELGERRALVERAFRAGEEHARALDAQIAEDAEAEADAALRTAADEAAAHELAALRERDALRAPVRAYLEALDAARARGGGGYMAERERTLEAERMLREAAAAVESGEAAAAPSYMADTDGGGEGGNALLRELSARGRRIEALRAERDEALRERDESRGARDRVVRQSRAADADVQRADARIADLERERDEAREALAEAERGYASVRAGMRASYKVLRRERNEALDALRPLLGSIALLRAGGLSWAAHEAAEQQRAEAEDRGRALLRRVDAQAAEGEAAMDEADADAPAGGNAPRAPHESTTREIEALRSERDEARAEQAANRRAAERAASERDEARRERGAAQRKAERAASTADALRADRDELLRDLRKAQRERREAADAGAGAAQALAEAEAERDAAREQAELASLPPNTSIEASALRRERDEAREQYEAAASGERGWKREADRFRGERDAAREREQALRALLRGEAAPGAARADAAAELGEDRDAAGEAAARDRRALRERDVLRRAVRGYLDALDDEAGGLRVLLPARRELREAAAAVEDGSADEDERSAAAALRDLRDAVAGYLDARHAAGTGAALPGTPLAWALARLRAALTASASREAGADAAPRGGAAERAIRRYLEAREAHGSDSASWSAVTSARAREVRDAERELRARLGGGERSEDAGGADGRLAAAPGDPDPPPAADGEADGEDAPGAMAWAAMYRRQRDGALRDRDLALGQRDEALRDRDAAHRRTEELRGERDDARRELRDARDAAAIARAEARRRREPGDAADAIADGEPAGGAPPGDVAAPDAIAAERDALRLEVCGADGKGGLKGALALAEAEGIGHARRAGAAERALADLRGLAAGLLAALGDGAAGGDAEGAAGALRAALERADGEAAEAPTALPAKAAERARAGRPGENR